MQELRLNANFCLDMHLRYAADFDTPRKIFFCAAPGREFTGSHCMGGRPFGPGRRDNVPKKFGHGFQKESGGPGFPVPPPFANNLAKPFGLEVDVAVEVRRDHLRLGDGDEGVVAELRDEELIRTDDVEERRTARSHAIFRNAEQVTGPIADVATGLLDALERDDRATSVRRLVVVLGALGSSGHGKTLLC